MHPTSPTHFILVDFENRPIDDLSALSGLPVVVVLFLGQKSRLKKALIDQIETLPFEVRLIKVGVTGKNAADFILTYHLGAIMARHPGERYYVISGDDFEPVTTHLTNNHHPVSRHSEIASLPFLTKQKPAPKLKVAAPAKVAVATKKPVEDRRTKVIARLKDPANRNRPLDATALRAHIKSALGKTATDSKVEDVVQELVSAGTLVIEPNGKVTYSSKGV